MLATESEQYIMVWYTAVKLCSQTQKILPPRKK